MSQLSPNAVTDDNDDRLTSLPLDVRWACRRALEVGGLVDVWEAYGRPFASIYGMMSTDQQTMFAEIKRIDGWGEYNAAMIVWGWEQAAGRPQ